MMYECEWIGDTCFMIDERRAERTEHRHGQHVRKHHTLHHAAVWHEQPMLEPPGMARWASYSQKNRLHSKASAIAQLIPTYWCLLSGHMLE